MMARIFFQCLLLALIELAACVALVLCLYIDRVPLAVLCVIGAAIAGALLGPADYDRKALHQFIEDIRRAQAP